MNHIHKLVWSTLRGTWVATSEAASNVGARRGSESRKLRRLGAAVSLAIAAGSALAQTAPLPTALPQGGHVVQGQATLQGGGSANAPVLNINQSSQRAVIDWQTFNVGAAGTVNFNQPNSQSATLNRVNDVNPSQIFGHINANGQVTLVNPNGVYFSPGAVLDVGALTATTMQQSDGDFMAGGTSFTRSGSTGSVVNAGSLNARLNGYIALLAPQVRNEGVIVAQQGAVALAAGEAIRLNFDAASRLTSLTVTPSQIAALVENKTAVEVGAGMILLSATALDALHGSVVNSGRLSASSLVAKGGRIVLEGDEIQLAVGSAIDARGATGGGTVLIGGDWQGSGDMHQAHAVAMAGGASVDVSATERGDGGTAVLRSDTGDTAGRTRVEGQLRATGGAQGGDGGRIETSGAHLSVGATARVDTQAAAGRTGNWLLDPQDFSVAAVGGDVSGAALSTNLASSNVTIASTAGGTAGTGSVYINDAVNWSANTTLTLAAVKDIIVTGSIAASGNNAGLNLYYGGTNGTTAPAAGELRVSQASGAHIDLTGSAPSPIGNEAYTVVNSVAQFQAMSNASSARYALGQDLSAAGTTYTSALHAGTFTGKLDGLGHAVDALKIRTATGSNLGLFAQLDGATVRELGITNVDIQTNSGNNGVGQVFRIGALAGNVGGAGAPVSHITTIDNVWSSGLINTAAGSQQRIFFAGGLVGSQNGGTMNIARSYSTATVSSQGSTSHNLSLGGLVGDIGINTDITTAQTQTTSATVRYSIDQSYATGSIVEGGFGFYYGAGGLVGVTFASGGSITDSFSWSNVVGTGSFGGIVGYAIPGTYARLYTTGPVVMGGGVGATNSYNGSALGVATGNGAALPPGWSASVWNVGALATLKGLALPRSILYVKLVDPQGTSIGDATYGAFDGTYQIVDSNGSAVNLGSLGLAAPSGTAVYSLDNSSPANVSAPLYQASYLRGLSLAGANAGNYSLSPYSLATSYRIEKAALVVAANNASATYSGVAYSGGNGATYTGFVNGETTAVLGGALAYGGSSQGAVNAGSYAITPGGLAATNYILTYTPGALTITPATLTVTANNDAKFISQTDSAGYSGVSYSGFVNGQTAAVLSGSAAVMRSNLGVDAAGVYTGVLVPSGVSSSNYAISFVPGTYTVVPANQLLVRFNGASSTYGGAAPYSVASAQYLASDNTTIVDLTGAATVQGTTVTIDDGANGSGHFAVAPTNASHSGAGLVNVGSYQLGATAASSTSANFIDAPVVVGVQQVAPKGVAVQASGVTKVYDGTTDASGLVLGSGGFIAGDAVNTIGQGGFASRNAGTGVAYSVTGLTLTGADAANYFLTGGTSLAGNNGVILPKPVTLTAPSASRVYDGTTVYDASPAELAALGQQLGITADLVNSIALAFDDKNVGVNKALTPSAAVIADGNGGANYAITYAADHASSITRLASVTWVGGRTGNWFDPANWAGGTVPDLANVASVVIPADVVVSFNDTIVAPAQLGKVEIDSLGTAGGLAMRSGELAVGDGGIRLDSLDQTGGILTSRGPINVGSFVQTSGSTATDGDFTATREFAQTGDGTLSVGGSTHITDTGGDLIIGNLKSVGPAVLTSTDGPITQWTGTKLETDDTLDLNARKDGAPADITLDSERNHLVGKVSADGDDIVIVTDGRLLIGTIKATGDLTLRSHGDLDLGTTDVGGDLDANSGNGNVTQDGPLTVDGKTHIDAGTGSVVLTDPGNRFGGAIDIHGMPVQLGRGNDGSAGVPSVGEILNSVDALHDRATAELQPTRVWVIDSGAQEAADSATSIVRARIGDEPRRLAAFEFDLPAEPAQALRATAQTARATRVDGAALPGWLVFDARRLHFSAVAVPQDGLPIDAFVSAGPVRVQVQIR